MKNGMFDVQDFTTYRNSITTLDEGLIESVGGLFLSFEFISFQCLDRCYHVQPISISRSGTAEGKVDVLSAFNQKLIILFSTH